VNYDEFLAQVRDRGEYPSREDAEQVATAVLEVLGTREAGAELTRAARPAVSPGRPGRGRAPGSGRGRGRR
jgi:hypothetical protein